MIKMDRTFGWIFTAFGVCALAGVAFCGAWWHLLTAAACGVLAWMLFRDAKEEAKTRKGNGGRPAGHGSRGWDTRATGAPAHQGHPHDKHII